jgi:uroporphyrinogen decarboxylase
MRQAGRALPEYRALKLKHSFLEMVQTPELATEVTLQPIRRFGFDAAVLFSDILVICEGLGQPYRFAENGGIQMDFTLQTAADVERLQVSAVTKRLNYVAEALQMIKAELGNRTALLGFAGSPWTLANYMVEGGGVREYSKAKALFYSQPKLFAALMDKLTEAVSSFLQLQINAGADAVQLFDSLAGNLGDGSFAEASGRWIERIVASVQDRVPVIVFARGAHGNWRDLSACGAQVLGVDWNIKLAEVASMLPPNVAVQGNLDPFVLTAAPEQARAETNRILDEMAGRAGHIFNLGHGVPPTARLDTMEAVVAAVRSRT